MVATEPVQYDEHSFIQYDGGKMRIDMIPEEGLFFAEVPGDLIASLPQVRGRKELVERLNEMSAYRPELVKERGINVRSSNPLNSAMYHNRGSA